MATMLEGIEPPVKIYIRRGATKEQRTIGFIIPDWISQGEILDNGWAIDGNQVLFTVHVNELVETERRLVDLFRQKGGHGITFC